MNAEVVSEVLSWIFIAAGSIFVLIGGLGLLRLPDFYTRIHAAGITDTMGAWLILIGTSGMLRERCSGAIGKRPGLPLLFLLFCSVLFLFFCHHLLPPKTIYY